MLMSARESFPDLGDRYRIEEVLSEHERSACFAVRERDSGALQFLKLGSPATAADPVAFRTFRHEPSILKRLERDAGRGVTPRVLDEGTILGRPYFVLEYLAGYSLADRLRSRLPLDGPSALRVVTRVLELLQAIHLAGIAHGDISPENIQVVTDEPLRPGGIIPPRAGIFLVDYETARRLDGPENRPGLPVAGRPSYLAPEILRGHPLSPRSDLFAVGVVFFELLTGETPYPADCLLDTDQPPSFEPAPIPLDLEVPTIIEGLARHLIEPDPGRRISTAGEALRELRHIEELRRWLVPATAPAAIHQAPASPAPPPAPSPPPMPSPFLPALDDFDDLPDPATHSHDDFDVVSMDDIEVVSPGATGLPGVPASSENQPLAPPAPEPEPEPEPVVPAPGPKAVAPATAAPAFPEFGSTPAPDTGFDPADETALPTFGGMEEKQTAAGAVFLDDLAFTVIRPKVLSPGIWSPVTAWVHREQDEPGPEGDALDFPSVSSGVEDPGAGSSGDDGDPSLPAPGVLTLIPHVPGVEFEPERRDLPWGTEPIRAAFRARAGSGLSGRTARGFLSIYSGGILIGEVRLAIPVDFERAEPSPAGTGVRDRAAPFLRIFVSHCPRDLDVVDRVEQIAARLRDGYLREWLAARGSEGWTGRLPAFIDRAQVFQLLWSTRSMDHPVVRSEYELALSRKRSHFIRPSYWEEPFPKSDSPALPPEGLRALRFEKLSLASPMVTSERVRPLPRAIRLRDGAMSRESSTPPPHPAPGLEGSLEGYQILNPIGSPAADTIHLARHIRTGNRVVIKRSQGWDVDAAIYAEALQWVGARHPATVPVVDAFQLGTTSFIVREYHEGKGLGELLKAGRPGLCEGVEIAASLAERVHQIHKLGRMHRDLKPSNILVDEAGVPRLWADHLVGFPKGPFLTYLYAKGVYGTPAYMAPERITESSLRHEPRSDIYALGVILYELLTGRCPFVGRTRNQLLIKILTEAPPPPSEVADGITPALDAICLRCLEKSVDNRYEDAGALAEALNRWLSLETDSDQDR